MKDEIKVESNVKYGPCDEEAEKHFRIFLSFVFLSLIVIGGFLSD